MITIYYQFKNQTQEGRIKIQDMQGYRIINDIRVKSKEEYDQTLKAVRDTYKDANFCEMVY